MGDPDIDAVDELFYGYPDTMCARRAAGSNGATGRSLVSVERSSALRSRQSEAREGMVQLRVIGIAVDQVAPIVKQSEAPRRVGRIHPPHTFFSHHEPPALLARHDAFAIGLPPYA